MTDFFREFRDGIKKPATFRDIHLIHRILGIYQVLHCKKALIYHDDEISQNTHMANK